MTTERIVRKLGHSSSPLLLAMGWIIVAMPIAAGFLNAPASLAQSQAPQVSTETGTNPKFVAISIKQNKDAIRRIAPSQLFRKAQSRTEGVSDFAGKNRLLIFYVAFAYPMKFGGQQYAMSPQLPSWVASDTFDIQAQAQGNPSEAEAQEMLKSLLADRFKLAVHYETRQIPELVVELVKSGKTGLRLQPHPANAPCADASGPIWTQIVGVFPATCGVIVGLQPSAPGRMALGGRNVSMELIASTLPWMLGDMSKAGINQTGLSGTTYDFAIEWVPKSGEAGTGQLPTSNLQPDPTGLTLQQALEEQLGLKVNATQGPMQVLVIDHVERPSEVSAAMQQPTP